MRRPFRRSRSANPIAVGASLVVGPREPRHRHFNRGSSSFHEIPALRFHNEPDGGFWRGSDAEFVDVFNPIFNGLHTALGISPGGAGFTRKYSLLDGDERETDRALLGGLDHCPLGFVSFHAYGEGDGEAETPASLANFLLNARNVVDGQTAGWSARPPLHVTEWNLALLDPMNAEVYTCPHRGCH